MDYGYFICAMLFVASLLSTLVLGILCKYNCGKLTCMRHLRTIFAFYFLYYFVVSGLKWYLGSPDNTLVESFWDAEMVTYIHYGIPIILIAILAPVIVRILFRDKVYKFIEILSSVSIVDYGVLLLLMGEVRNCYFTVSFAVLILISAAFTWFYKQEMPFLSDREYNKASRILAPSVFIFVFMIVLYYPCELYLSNVDEFMNPFGQFLLILAVGTIVISVAVIFLMLTLPKPWISMVGISVAGLAVLSYIQANFLNGKLESLTGDEQNWQTPTIVVNLALWIVAMLIIVISSLKWDWVRKIALGICVYICLIQAATLGYMALTTDTSQNSKRDIMTTWNSLEIAQDENVIIFVLDLFDSSVFQEVMEENVDFMEPLSDFTYYRNATSMFGHTGTAIPYLLTGTKWDSGFDVSEYRKRAYEESTLLADIKNQGYDLGIYTSASYISDSVYGMISNYTNEISVSSNVFDTIGVMVKTSMYKVSPFLTKNCHAYYSSDIISMIDSSQIWNIENDFPFYYSLIDDGLEVSADVEKAFRFYHMRGDHGGEHGAYYLSEDLKYDKTQREISVYSQAKGCLKIVYEYLRQLQELGKYDDATIIITADHGNIVEYDEENNRPTCTSMPIMLVKMPFDHNDSLAISDTPVSQGEIAPTIEKAIGMNAYDGYAFDETKDGELVRYFTDIMQDYYRIKYKIDGDANNIDSWTAESVEYMQQ